MVPTTTLIRSIALVVMTPAAQAAGDAKNRRADFQSMQALPFTRGGQERIGPTLYRLLGRKAGTVAGYNYSAAMQGSGIIWNRDTLARFLADPNMFIPGTKMVFAGIRNVAQLDDLIAYLSEATQ
jgi:cytochrome c